VANGKLSLRLFLKSSAPEDADNRNGLSEFLPLLTARDNTELTMSETQSLVFIACYVVHKVVPELSCDLRPGELICDKTLQYNFSPADFTYLYHFDCVGLTGPTKLDMTAKANASGSERATGRATANVNFLSSERNF
jgi:hypothetical protein